MINETNNISVELFSTNSKNYLFDYRNVVFIEIDGELIFEILKYSKKHGYNKNLIKNEFSNKFDHEEIYQAFEIIDDFQNKGFLKNYNFERSKTYSHDKINSILETELNSMILFITTNCNLGCSYCLYGGSYDRHGTLNSKNMTWETAKKSVDYYISRSNKNEKFVIHYFGGEPTLNIDLIQKIHIYASTFHPDVVGTISSNGTLISDGLLNFISDNNVLLQISIDLEKKCHDSNRKFKTTNKPTYDEIIKKLYHIKNNYYSVFNDKLKLKAVISYSQLNYYNKSEIDQIIIDMDKLGNVAYIMEEPDYELTNSEYYNQLIKMKTKLLSLKGINTLKELEINFNPKEIAFFANTFGRFFSIQSYNSAKIGNAPFVTYSKGCLPGKESAIKTNGDITICSKSNSFILGNVNSNKSISINANKYYDLLHNENIECKNCFIQRFCDLCFEKLNSKDFNTSRNRYCNFSKQIHLLIFDTMLNVMDNNPELWKEIGNRHEFFKNYHSYKNDQILVEQ